MGEAEQTSLQRLLALDKTFDTLNDRVEAAADILSLSSDPKDRITLKTYNYGRYDFVFRWVLDKLKKDTAARANSTAWALLRRILTAVPVSKVPDLLANSAVTGVVILALAEHFENIERPLFAANPNPSKPLKHKKRKRGETQDESQNSYAQQHAIFTELSRLVHSVNFPLSLPLTVDLTKLWFNALYVSSLQADVIKFPDDAKFFDAEIQFITQSWAAVTSSFAELEVQSSFAQSISWSALMLATRLYRLGLISSGDNLRDFVLHEFLDPSHDSFARLMLSGSSKAITQDDVQSRFSPISDHITSYLTKSNPSIQDRETLPCDMLSLLFESGYKFRNHHTPREKRAHGNWIESLFLHFSSAIDQIYQDGVMVESKKRLIMSMLDHVGKDGNALRGSLLEKVVHEYGGLEIMPLVSANDMRRPDFGVIARVLTLDPTIFHEGQTDPALSLRCLLENINFHSSRTDVGVDVKEVERWVYQLALPLIRAQSQPQHAEKFFEAWTSALAIYTLESAGTWCLWQYPEVRDALSHLIGTSLDIVAIRRSLGSAVALLKSAVTHAIKISSKQKRSVSTSLLGLALIVDIIRSDETIDELQTMFQELLTLAIHSLPALQNSKILRTHLWQLLIQLNERVVPGYDSSVNANFFTQAMRDEITCFKDAFQYLLESTSTGPSDLGGTAAALTYCLQMVSFYSEHKIALWEGSPDICMIFQDKSDDEGRAAIVNKSFIRRFPHLFASAFTHYPRFSLGSDLYSGDSPIHTDLLKLLRPKSTNPWSEKLFLHVLRTASDRQDPRRSADKERMTDWAFGNCDPDPHFLSELLAFPKTSFILRSDFTYLDSFIQEFLRKWNVGRADPNDLSANVAAARDLSSHLKAAVGLAARDAVLGTPPKTNSPTSQLSLFKSVLHLGKLIDEHNEQRTAENLLLYKHLCSHTISKANITAEDVRSRSEDADADVISFANKFLLEFESSCLRLAQWDFVWHCVAWLSNAELLQFLDEKAVRTAATAIHKISSAPDAGADPKLGSCVQALSLPKTCWRAAGHDTHAVIEEAKSNFDEMMLLREHVLLRERSAMRTSQLERLLVEAVVCELKQESEVSEELGNLPSDREWYLCDAIALLGTDLTPHLHHDLEQQMLHIFSSKWPIAEVTKLACTLFQGRSPSPDIGEFALANLLVRSLPTTVPQESRDHNAGLGIVSAISGTVDRCTDSRVLNVALQTLEVVLKEKRWLVNQRNLECVLGTLHKLCSPSTTMRNTIKARFFCNDICNILRLILQHHRPSLGGRLHFVIPLLKQVMACFFTRNKGLGLDGGQAQHIFLHPPWLDQDAKPLLPKHGQLFSRLITSLCNPPQSTLPGYRAGTNQPRLIDVVREARLHVSEFVPTLVHSFCQFQLHGVLGEGMREALTPAVDAMFDVMDMAEPEDQRVIDLGASMSKAELALLRKEHGEWKRFGRWRGA